MLSAKCWPFCLGFNVLTVTSADTDSTENKRYRQFCNIRCTQSQDINVSRFVLLFVFAQSIEAMC